ncbi:MAG: hypothetical protein J7501_18345, partial [Bdellovibrio sp.]|nr:hypothetical protein [Bdellovibrio sp.]
ILIKMVKKIYRQGFSSFNRGSVYNGTMNAAFQEERVYLSLLNELLTPNKDAYVMNMPGILAKAPTQPLLVEVETQFAILNSMVKKIQIVQIDGKERIQSPLENSQFEEQLTKIQAALKKVQQAMGIKDASSKVFTENTPSEPAPPVLVQVNKAQRNMAVQALESLEAVASEMMMYGTMANAMSWDKIRNLKQVSAAQKAFQDEIEKKKHQLGGGMTAPGR